MLDNSSISISFPKFCKSKQKKFKYRQIAGYFLNSKSKTDAWGLISGTGYWDSRFSCIYNLN